MPPFASSQHAHRAAHADFLYTISTIHAGFPIQSTFQFVEPSILTSDTVITPSQLLNYSGPTFTTILFDPTDYDCPHVGSVGPNVACIEVENTSAFTETIGYTQDLTSLGTVSHPLPVTIAVYAPTPEPSSLLLLGTGVLSMAGIARRRLRIPTTP